MVPALIAAMLAVVAGCSNKSNSEQQVREGVAYAKRMFASISTEKAAALSFASTCDMGGSPLSYLAANIGESSPKARFCEGRPDGPFSVVVSFDNSQGVFIIEGYGADTNKPFITEKVEYKAGQRPAAPASVPDRKQQEVMFFNACSDGDTGTVTKLIAQKMDVNLRSSEGCTPLMYACIKGQVDVVRILLGAGADSGMQANSPEKWPVIMYAAHAGSPEIVTMLIEKGADVNGCDQFRNTPLMLAVMRGHTKAVEALVKAGADVNARETKRNNFPLLYATSGGRSDEANLLIKAGANVNQCDNTGLTPLMSCAERGHLEIAASLIKAKAGLEAQLTGDVGAGATALMLAAAKGHEQMVRQLLAAGANPKAKDKGGSAAQRYASHNGHEAIVQILQAPEQGNAAAPAGIVSPPDNVSSVQSAAGGATGASPQTLIGKDQEAANKMLGRPVGQIKKGEITVILYKKAEITIKDGIISEVKE